MAAHARVPVNPVIQSVNSIAAWSASGLPPASGFDRSGFYCKDWYIETQFMNYAYVRAPIGSISSMDFGLSTMNLNTTIEGTTLLVQFNTLTTATSSDFCYETSTYFQPQQFEINSFTYDEYGISYGTPAAGTFGPNGSIVSYKPFINRRELESTDEIYTEVRTGTNWGIVTVKSVAECNNSDGWLYPGMDLGIYGVPVKEFIFSNNTTLVGTGFPFCGALTLRQTGARLASKTGPYSTSQDTTADVQEATDTLGHLVKIGAHLRDSTNTHFYGDSHYDPNRHYWA